MGFNHSLYGPPGHNKLLSCWRSKGTSTSGRHSKILNLQNNNPAWILMGSTHQNHTYAKIKLAGRWASAHGNFPILQRRLDVSNIHKNKWGKNEGKIEIKNHIKYNLETYHRSNQDTCLIQKPAIKEGDWVRTGDLLADSASSIGGELALGHNIIVAYMPWEGYNYEDAILINERLVYEDIYTSVHIERYEIQTKDTKLGFEQITREIPDTNENEISHLDQNGIAKIGSWVEEGDILVGKVTPFNVKTVTPQQKLLYKIFDKELSTTKDSSLRAPKGIKANVINVNILARSMIKDGPVLSSKINNLLTKKKPPVAKKVSLLSPWADAHRPKANNILVNKKEPFENSQKSKLPFKKAYYLQDRKEGQSETLKARWAEAHLRSFLFLPAFAFGKYENSKRNLSIFPGATAPAVRAPLGEGTGRHFSIFINTFRCYWGFSPRFNNNNKKFFKNISLDAGLDTTASIKKAQGKSTSSHFYLLKLIKKVELIKKPKYLKKTSSYKSKNLNGKEVFRVRVDNIRTKTLIINFAKKVSLLSPWADAHRPKANNILVYKNMLVPFGFQSILKLSTGLWSRPSLLDKTISTKGKIVEGVKSNFLGSLLGRTTKTKGFPSYVHLYLAEKRKILVGDKLAGRHGNKGIISRILPRQDMPFLPDGTLVDIVLNPLGVPSRMNVGQIYECLLGLAGRYLGEHYKIPPFDESYGADASRSFVLSKLYEARKKTGLKWLFDPNNPGKIRLFDGRSSECFDQTVTVGIAYVLKLVHMVDDKIHARSTGPYSLVTQQPLRGRSKQGGQRLGEMEVWAIEGYGAAFVLSEMLTIKSDDMTGRQNLWKNLIENNEISLGSPESFKVLVCELQALCLDIGLFRKNVNIRSHPSAAAFGTTRDLEPSKSNLANITFGRDKTNNSKQFSRSWATAQALSPSGDAGAPETAHIKMAQGPRAAPRLIEIDSLLNLA
uniref:DNA-directed RNA polymerase n=1 Tax=Tetrabaena socialis TaxID=47790 RepID=A0A1B1FKC4_9CHLO|nr:RNA polymerase subunit beta b [Tetrabaena socialis]